MDNCNWNHGNISASYIIIKREFTSKSVWSNLPLTHYMTIYNTINVCYINKSYDLLNWLCDLKYMWDCFLELSQNGLDENSSKLI